MLLVSCVVTGPGGISVSGPIWLVSRENIQLAITAARAGNPKFATAKVGKVDVISRSEVVVGFYGDFGDALVERVDGQWRYIREQDRILI